LSSGMRLSTALLCAVCGIIFAIGQWRPLPTALLGVPGYACLALLPGIAVLAWMGRELRSLSNQAAVLGLGPVIGGSATALLMISGLSLHEAVTAGGILFAVAATSGLILGPQRTGNETDGAPAGGARAAWLIAGAAIALVAVFPFLGEGWRLRSDAWFHVAVISELKAFGLPPTDPFFSGLPLQYMWLYHVYAAGLAQASGVDVSWAMAFINFQAIACLVIAVFALSKSLGGTRSGAALSSIFVLVGINGLFWVFLPFKLLRTLVGETRGLEELNVQLSLFALDMLRMRTFVAISKSQPFLLDKFIVATAFSLGVCLTLVFAAFAYKYISGGRTSAAVVSTCAMAGIALYHTPTALAFGGAAGIALFATLILSPRSHGRRAAALLLCLVLAVLATAPYLYNVTSGKESSQFLPLGLSLKKTGAILVSCAAALLFAGPSLLRFLRSRGSPSYFYGLFALAALIVSLVLVLPGPNTFDKTPYFAFLLLTPPAGWGIRALYKKGRTRFRRVLIATACLAATVPSSAFMYAAYLSESGRPPTPAEDKSLYAWVDEHTPRDAVFVENMDRVGMAVLGPRRLLWGRESYADQWGYEKDEMEARRRIRDALFSEKGLSQEDAERLKEYGRHVYVIVRSEDFPDDRRAGVADSPRFSLVYSADGINLYRFTPDQP